MPGTEQAYENYGLHRVTISFDSSISMVEWGDKSYDTSREEYFLNDYLNPADEGSLWDRGMYRWFRHSSGDADPSITRNGENYTTIYRPDSSIPYTYVFSEGVIGLDGLPSYTDAAIDLAAVVAAAAPDMEGRAFERRCFPAIFFGLQSPPTPAQFWTAMINATEIV